MELNMLEKEFLNIIDWRLTVSMMMPDRRFPARLLTSASLSLPLRSARALCYSITTCPL